MYRRQVPSLLVLLALGAGCTTPGDRDAPKGGSPTPVVGAPTETTTSTAGTGSPMPSSELSNEEAKARALRAEEAYITRRFENSSCLDGWGLTGYTGIEKEAIVTDRTADGVHVEVTQPYWYSTDRDEADGGSNARYRVTPAVIRRTSGDDVSPC
ncbi:hypothetical protein [Halorarum salinum]|uniref:Lipoprotein n=1 Tax=Halorarum salinum TaxID=2743089 RepID=A0A7D5LC14_9EURY|nr:hypothetical protein [Halobaculum salinum]QLG63172.1 hypothetical protein HUG12_16110 [Halobaculum salinum]